MRAERVEPLEHQTAVVAQELVHSKHTQEKDRVVIIALNPLAFASRALHRTILSKNESVSRRIFRIEIELMTACD